MAELCVHGAAEAICALHGHWCCRTGDITPDAAYDARNNCKAIVDCGRNHVIRPRDNAAVKGFNPRRRSAGTAGIRTRLPQTAGGATLRGQLIVHEARFGHHVAATKFAMRQFSPVLRAVCYDFTAVYGVCMRHLWRTPRLDPRSEPV